MLTEIEKGLIASLKLHGIGKGMAMAVCMWTDTEEKRLDMMEFLLSKEKVTGEEALDMARKIAGEETP